ncbi:MAG: Nre family DNA repair protein [Promethearchaeati archaeon SRVP18_Atabeyarchaeia-1]
MSQLRLSNYGQEAHHVSRCAQCRGFRRLCGKSICPILVKAKSIVELDPILKDAIHGSSPPGVFVGTWNYPKVLAGPLIPPILGEKTAIMDSPEMWLDKKIEDLLRYRFTLIRGKTSVKVTSAQNPDRMLQTVQEIVMASRPTETEASFSKKPSLEIVFSPREIPIGPSAMMDKLKLAENPAVPNRVDAIVSDTDLKATSGMVELYNALIPQRQITRLLSIGLLGTKKRRRLVPTEWSITATDDILGRKLHEDVTRFAWANDFMLFGHEALHNNVQALFLPSAWMFEALECWLVGPNPEPASDHELFQGRRTYASNIGGAYYAARLPALEYLKQIRRQAAVIAFLEVKQDWLPLGVFRFREILREALKNKPTRFNSLEGALYHLRRRLSSPLEIWTRKSKILEIFRGQKKITSWLET